MKNKIKAMISTILILISVIGMLLAHGFTEFAEWYSVHIFSFLSDHVGKWIGYLPFSLSEVLLYVLILLFIGTLAFSVYRLAVSHKTRSHRKRGTSGNPLLSWLSGVYLTLGILAFLYVFLCGINYQRISFAEKEGIGVREYSTTDLANVCVSLTKEVNARSEDIARDENGVMMLREDPRVGAAEAMQALSASYPSLSGNYPKPKEVLVSQLLSYQGISGVYSPFTIEANYNGDMSPFNIPFTACHELSHLRGFMQEEEANYIAYLACTASPRNDFAYSGYLTGWLYCMNALKEVHPSKWQDIMNTLSPVVTADLNDNSAFWDKYDGKISELNDKVNDGYLKANGQESGIKSYGLMVDLIVTGYLQ